MSTLYFSLCLLLCLSIFGSIILLSLYSYKLWNGICFPCIIFFNIKSNERFTLNNKVVNVNANTRSQENTVNSNHEIHANFLLVLGWEKRIEGYLLLNLHRWCYSYTLGARRENPYLEGEGRRGSFWRYHLEEQLFA